MKRPSRAGKPKPPLIRKRTRYGTSTAEVLAKLKSPEPKGVAELVSRMREDYQVTLAELVIGGNVHAARTTVSVAGAAGESAQILARHLQKLWDATLPKMLDAFAFGRVAFEKAWGYRLGLNYIESLDPLPFQHTSMCIAQGGAFEGLELSSDDSSVDIPADNCWWLAVDATAMAPHGCSRFLGAPYKVFCERQRVIRLRQVFTRKLMVGGGTVYAPFELEQENGQTLDVAQVLADMHASRESGAANILPNDRDKEGHRLFEFTEGVTVKDCAPIDAHIDGLDQEQLQAFGIPPKTVLEGDSTGSFAMVSQQMLTLFAVCEDILKQFEASFQKYVIDKEIEANYLPADRPAITIAHQPLSERPDSVAVEVVKLVLGNPQLSPLLLSGAIDTKALLEAAGIPVSEKAQGAIEAMIRAAAVAAQQGPARGADMANPSSGAAYDLCGGKGGKPGPCPDPGRRVRKNREPRTKPERKSVGERARRALSTYKAATKEKQSHAEQNEHVVTKKLGGTKSGDNSPADVTLNIDGRNHGIELKTMLDNGNDKITMHPESRRRKEAWARKNKAVLHTVVIDHRDRFADGANGHQYSGHEIYYKRGAGAFRVGSMHKVKNYAELKTLLGTPTNSLPAEAR